MFWYGISRIWNLQMTVRHWHRRSGRALQRRRLREGREVWKGFPEHQEVRSGNKNTDIVNHLLLMDKCCKTSWYWKYTCRCIYTYVYICILVYIQIRIHPTHYSIISFWSGELVRREYSKMTALEKMSKRCHKIPSSATHFDATGPHCQEDGWGGWEETW